MYAEVAGVGRLSEVVIGCAFRGMIGLGADFRCEVYKNAMAHGLRKVGPAVLQQQAIKVDHDSIVVGEYMADLLVNDSILVEMKAVCMLDKAHVAQ